MRLAERSWPVLTEYGVSASVEMRLLDEETVEVAAVGDDLGLLVGLEGQP